MDFVNVNNFGDSAFTVDTKINDLSKWGMVENIAYEKIYRYIKARGAIMMLYLCKK